jgi:rhombotail lipoprotein
MNEPRSVCRVLALLPACALALACSTLPPARQSSSALEFLYPEGNVPAVAASNVTLHLPVRVGLAFAPGSGDATYGVAGLTESQRQSLLGRVAAAFRETKGVSHLEVVPSLYLQPAGGFANLDRLRGSLGVDLMVLVSFDQTQFTESTRLSWSYLTVVGPLLIQGEKNEVHTLMDAVVYDVPSRALLFRAAGESKVGGRSSPLNETTKRRRFSAAGFEKATDDLIAHLREGLASFEEETKKGTVRGQGTPQIALFDAQGERLNPPPGSGGAGALGPWELLLALGAGAALLSRRR